MSDEKLITIEVDGRPLQAKAGTMLIDVTDEAGIPIPRFCYHKKLSVAANCRQCLVEVEKVPRPLPACATPVADGMKVRTRSPMAIAAQKGTMEFLLINHPLDCPICDQGGECELQDIAMGYGRDVTRYVEGKRVVADPDLGPLIATDFTRCIHCTRCVRFGAEIAGIRELGATGRGEHMHIGTYVDKQIDSELSGNVIDLCPVGALTSKPFRYQARAWELVQRDGIAPHDSVGSNIHIHLRNGRVMRVHPMENEAVNECWISDRDRFSYQGLYSDDRLTAPMVKRNGQWSQTTWEEALDAAAKGLRQARGQGGDRLGALISPNATVEESFLAQRLLRGLGSENIDSRLRQGDFRGAEPKVPWLGMAIADLESVDAALLIGANPRKEEPLLGHRLRKAALEGGQIAYLNPQRLDLNYRATQLVAGPAAMVAELAAIANALGVSDGPAKGAKPSADHQGVAERLKGAKRGIVLLGNVAVAHPDYALLRGLAGAIAKKSGATLGFLPEAANSLGARLAGAVPGHDGATARTMLEHPRKGYLLVGLEPDRDLWDPATAMVALKGAECVVALTAYRSPGLEAAADVLLPIAAFAETSGSYVNAEGRWQSFAGATRPLGEARPGWKVLRVLGNLFDLQGFEQVSSEQVLAEAREAAATIPLDNAESADLALDLQAGGGLLRLGDVPIYAADPLVRRAVALQRTHDAVGAGVYLNPSEAGKAGLGAGDQVQVRQGDGQVTLQVVIDEALADGCARIPAGLAESAALGGQIGVVTLEKA